MDISPELVFAGFGALGGLIRTFNWILDEKKKPENEREKFDVVLLSRNVLVGAVVGMFADTSNVNAFSAGFVGEWLISKMTEKLGAFIKV